MACKRSAVRSRLPPPTRFGFQYWSPSSRGLGHRPFTAITGVRIPVGTPVKTRGYRKVAPFYLAVYRICTEFDAGFLCEFRREEIESSVERHCCPLPLTSQRSPSLPHVRHLDISRGPRRSAR